MNATSTGAVAARAQSTFTNEAWKGHGWTVSRFGGLQCHPVSELKGILWFVEGIAFSNMNKNEQTLTIASV